MAYGKMEDPKIFESIPGKRCAIYNPRNTLLGSNSSDCWCTHVVKYNVTFTFKQRFLLSINPSKYRYKISRWDYDVCKDHLEYVLRVYPEWFGGSRELLRIVVKEAI